MKASKQPTGIKVKKAKGKRVSLRCPLSIERTDLEYNYDTSALQICMTVENMGGGGLASDTVESAVLVVRLFEADGKIHPCRENEYFAKLLRFGENGLESGARITFRLLPDCDGGTRVEDTEIYISRIRYTDGTVTDYVRGDFFDLPGEGTLLTKHFKKSPEAAVAMLGEGAIYLPEKLTEIVWRCTCGDFSESDTCPTCNRNKNELFAALDVLTTPKSKKPVAVPVTPPVTGTSAEENASPATTADQTAEYSTTAAKAALAAMEAENGNLSQSADDSDESENEEAANASTELSAAPTLAKTRNILLIAISASGAVLLIILLLLILTLCGRSDSPETTTTTGDPTIQNPSGTVSGAEKVVRSYLAQKDFDNALGYAVSSGCDAALISEIYQSAIQYYFESGQIDKALEWSQKANEATYVTALTLQLFHAALAGKDYVAAEQWLNALDAKDRTDPARAYADALIADQKYTEALGVADKYLPTQKAEVAKSAVQALLMENRYDEAISIAKDHAPAEVATAATSATDYYILRGDFNKAAEYVGMTNSAEKKQIVLEQLSDSQIRRYLPSFFSLLSFEKKQAAHSVLLGSKTKEVAAIDEEGNVYLGTKLIYEAATYVEVPRPDITDEIIYPVTGEPITGELIETPQPDEPLYELRLLPAVSVSCTDGAVVILLSDGTVRIAEGSNQYYSQASIAAWTDIVAISASNYHLLGLRVDGTVVAVGSNVYGQCGTADIQNAVAISAGNNHTLILHADGTVTALGQNNSGQCNTASWTGIIAISAGDRYSIGLKADGSVVSKGYCDVTGWTDVVAVFSNTANAVALKADGTLLYSINNQASNALNGVKDAAWVSVGKQAVTVLHKNGKLSTTLLSGSTTPTLPAKWRTDPFGIE